MTLTTTTTTTTTAKIIITSTITFINIQWIKFSSSNELGNWNLNGWKSTCWLQGTIAESPVFSNDHSRISSNDDVNELNELVLATALVAVTVIASHCSRRDASTFVAIQLSRCSLRAASTFPAIQLRPYAAIHNEYNVAGFSTHEKVFVVVMRYIGPSLDMEKKDFHASSKTVCSTKLKLATFSKQMEWSRADDNES